MSKERRTAPREALALPALIGSDIHGVTRDVSESGFFVETGFDHALGSELDIELTFELPAACFRFTARGAVVRNEPIGHHHGLAVKLNALQLARVDELNNIASSKD